MTVTDPRIGGFHNGGPDTEREAARSVRAITGTLRGRVLTLLAIAGEYGLTDDEGGELIGGDRLTFGRRRQELVASGIVRDSGMRRLTPAKRRAVVWVLT